MKERFRIVARTLLMGARLDRASVLIILFIILGQAVSTAAVAAGQRRIVDQTGLGVDTALLVVVVLAAAAYAANAAGNRIQVNLRENLAERVDLAFSQEVLADVARVPTVDHLERKDFLDRFQLLKQGTADIADASWMIADLLAAVASLLLSVVLLATVHPALVLLVVLGVPSLLAAQRGQRHIRRGLSDAAARRRQEQQLHELCIMPGPAAEVRTSINEAALGARADAIWAEVTALEVRGRTRSALWQLAGWACFGAGFIVTFIVLASLAGQGRASLGDIALVVMLASRLRVQISLTIGGFNSFAGALHAIDQYVWIRNHARMSDEAAPVLPATVTNGIELRAVGFAFPDAAEPTLRDISVTLRSGSTVGIVGSNGAGKSTLVKILTGMYRPTGGSILLDGVPVSSLATREWVRRCSGAFQDFAKFQFVCAETVGAGDLPRIDDRDAVAAAVRNSGAEGVVDQLPQGLDTQLGLVFGGRELSHGQWQKLALGRGLMRDAPTLLVFDEPTAALDPQAEHELFESFFAQSRSAARKGTITAVVSHRFSTVHNADLILVIADGTIAEQGTHAELLSANGHYAAMYRTQAAGYG